MNIYAPDVNLMTFILHDVLQADETLLKERDLDRDTVTAILDEAAKLARDVLAPLNPVGDSQGNKLEDGVVTTAKGFREAYAQYRDGGWNAVPFPEDFGGQDLPWTLAFPIQEMWQASNMSFGLCPLLNQGAVEAIHAHGSDAQKETYLPNLISGVWTGTMNLTEPQAGSDLAAIKTAAVKQDDGFYKISGQKIYITYGEHDFAENIIHLVLARTPDAPEGSKGISLFIVPKILEDGTRNDLKCVAMEHKLGIHASPTCTMSFGDNGGATGYLIGEENAGLKYMFTMMNNARLSVGLQGVAISERAIQAAIAYATDRVQGKSLTTGEDVVIAEHMDVKRMLITMQSLTFAGRVLAYEAALAQDLAFAGDAKAKAKQELMTPVVKAWCTDNALEVTSLGIQVYGGMGFVEETGVAQHYRDARILPIYEGTNGIQASDLAFRKILRDGGAAFKDWMAEATDVIGALSDLALKKTLEEACAKLENAVETLLKHGGEKDFESVAGLSTPFLQMMGVAMGGVAMARILNSLDKVSDPKARNDYEALATFYFSGILPRVHASAPFFDGQALELLKAKNYKAA
tara:strand:+ start:76561 stop:78288 length:1728 start_codon:yes stop_codon:yes gene_type:complete